MSPLNAWFYHNKIKKDFIRKNRITQSLPVLEFLLAGDIAKGDGAAFTVGQVRNILKKANAEKSDRTLYAVAKHCRQTGLIQTVTPGRQYYQPHRYFFTMEGLLLVSNFKNQLIN